MLDSSSSDTDAWNTYQDEPDIDPFYRGSVSTYPVEPPSAQVHLMKLWAKHLLESPPYEDTGQAPIHTLTDYDFKPVLSATAKLFRDFESKKGRTSVDARQMELRIAFLKSEARSEGEQVNFASEQDLWQFMKSPPFMKKPRIFLVNSRYLRAVWKGEHGEHVGLQFLGGGKIQYVIFPKRATLKNAPRHYGTTTFEDVLRLIASLDIEEVVFA